MNIGEFCINKEKYSIVFVEGFATEIDTIYKDMIIILDPVILEDNGGLEGSPPGFKKYGRLEQLQELYDSLLSVEWLRDNNYHPREWGKILLDEREEYIKAKDKGD